MSSRGLSADMLAAIAAGTCYPILFGYMDFPGGARRVCTDYQSVSWDGHTWNGLGEFVKVTPVRETTQVQANGLTLSLNGVSTGLIADALGARCRGRAFTMWQGFYNSSRTLLADPVIIFSGRMEQPVINNSGDTASVSIAVESRLAMLQRSRETRYTHAAQQALYAGDTGLQYIAALQNKEIVWGPTNSSAANSAAPQRGGGGGPADNRNYNQL